MELNDPRTRQRLAVEADIAPATLQRFLVRGADAVRPATLRRIREAQARLEAAETAKGAR